MNEVFWFKNFGYNHELYSNYPVVSKLPVIRRSSALRNLNLGAERVRMDKEPPIFRDRDNESQCDF